MPSREHHPGFKLLTQQALQVTIPRCPALDSGVRSSCVSVRRRRAGGTVPALVDAEGHYRVAHRVEHPVAGRRL